eukprot:GFKZ01000057.1.p1 GENE.GFKZ01000057.1~~GFKZ01000057.1.p1  ORF type:complete len:1202 (-),score=165.53 GFKZ01000057.1:2062-5667(-)
MTTAPSPYVEVEDLVRVPDSPHLFIVERVAGDSDSESGDESQTQSHDDDLSSDSSITDERGRLNRFILGRDQLMIRPPPTSNPIPTTGREPHLISSYDDDDANSSDDNDFLLSTNHQENNTHGHENHLSPIPPAVPAAPNLPPIPHNIPDAHAVIVDTFTGLKTLRPIAQLTPLDRNFDPGQLVMLAPDSEIPSPPVPQSAEIEKVHKHVLVRRVRDITPSTVDNPDPTTCFQIPSTRLRFFTGIRAGDSVVRGSWLGVVDYFVEEVFVEFPDHSIACIQGHRRTLRNVDQRTPDRIRPDPFREGLYYPGQRVSVLSEVLRSYASWIRGEFSGKNEGIVKLVRVRDLGVEFVAKSMYAKPDDESDRNFAENKDVKVVRFEDVTLLDSFRELWWTVGDLGLLIDPNQPVGAYQGGGQQGLEQQIGIGSMPGAQDFGEEDEGEWEEEEEVDNELHAGTASSADGLHRAANRTKSKKPGGRLTKAHRRARERSAANPRAGTVSDTAIENLSPNPDDVVQVVGTRSFVDLLWQDGTRSTGIPTLNLRINNHPDAYDFLPGEIVTKADDELYAGERVKESGNGILERKKGAIVSVNQAERTALVRWQRDEDFFFSEEEEVSVYELKTGDYDVTIGATVLRVPRGTTITDDRKEWVGVVTNQYMGKCTVTWNGGHISNVPCNELLYVNGEDEETFETEDSTEDVESDPNGGGQGHFRAFVIHTPHDPEYNHNWGPDEDADSNHMQSTRLADFGIGYGRTVISGLLSSPEIYRFRLDLEKQNYETAIRRAAEKVSRNLQANRERNGGPRAGSLSKNEERAIAAGLVFHVLGELFSGAISSGDLEDDLMRSMPPSPYEEWTRFIEAVVRAFERIFTAEAIYAARYWMRTPAMGRGRNEDRPSPSWESREEVERQVTKAEEDVTPTEREQMETESVPGPTIERFEILDDLPNFHVFSNMPSSSTYSTNFLSVIRKEWNRLRKNLPPGIIVRACEEKLDRIRAGIIGPQGTPYADVIFFFDIRLGPTYPMTPPNVWFHSHGRRLNPNLYEDGKVCLSILGTWDGDHVESWDAKTSNLLRLLLSLQALVFVDEPYYNEAGYGKQRGTDEGRKNSRVYNESAFLLSIRHVMQTLKPSGVPEDCRKVAVTHYQQSGARVLTKCRKLVAGEVVEGGFSGEGQQGECPPYSSSGFRKSLGQLLKPLEDAISSCYEE